MRDWLLFKLENKGFAINLSGVERVIMAVHILSGGAVASARKGIVNIHGELFPVLDLRVILGFGEKVIASDDQFILMRDGEKHFSLIVDKVVGLTRFGEDQLREIPAGSSFACCDCAIRDDGDLFPVINIREIEKKYLS